MPGAPPETVAQVKKSIKGLFSRRSRSKQQQQDATRPSSSKVAPKVTLDSSTGGASKSAVATSTTDQGTTSNVNPQTGHHIAEPSSVAEAKDIDLQPTLAQSPPLPTSAADTQPPTSATTTANINTTAPPDASKSNPAPPTAPVAKPEIPKTIAADEAKAAPTENAHGMSATSGPLGDHLAGEEFGLVGHHDDDDDDANELDGGGSKVLNELSGNGAENDKEVITEGAKEEKGEEDATEVLGRKGGEADGGVMNAAEKAKIEGEPEAEAVKKE